jgi:protein gp37
MGLSKIEWTDCTLNPIKARRKDTGKVGWHCEKCSPACTHCYACVFNRRNLPNGGTGLDYSVLSREKVDIFLDTDVLQQPLHWKKPRRIFMCSMTDLFGEFVPADMIAEVWRMFSKVPRHTYQVLTKRAVRMAQLMPRLVQTFGVLDNVQLGVTVENQEWANRRVPHLLLTEASTRFISYEPALGPVDFTEIELPEDLPFERVPAHVNALTLRDDEHFFNEHAKIDWVIAGGESGSQARPSHPDWFRRTRDQCQAYNVPFFFKQWGSYVRWEPRYSANEKRIRYVWPDPPKIERQNNGGAAMVCVGKKAAGRLLDGKEWKDFPGSGARGLIPEG